MARAGRPIPEGYHTITPQLTVNGAAEAVEFYKRAFDAVELMRTLGPDGKTVAHAELKIGDSVVFLSDEFPGMSVKSPSSLGGTTASIYVYVEDADAVFARVVAAGAQVQMPVTDMFWGDRMGSVFDPFGYHWAIATHLEDLSREELAERQAAFYAKMMKGT